MKQKTFTVQKFNKEVNKNTKNLTKQQKASLRCTMLYKALKYGKAV